MIALRKDGYKGVESLSSRDLIIALIAIAYSLWLIYAAGIKYLLLSALLYAPGAILFYKARRENNQVVFTNIEKFIFAAAVIGALIAAYGLYNGSLSL